VEEDIQFSFLVHALHLLFQELANRRDHRVRRGDWRKSMSYMPLPIDQKLGEIPKTSKCELCLLCTIVVVKS
jgi:hypothetical protein